MTETIIHAVNSGAATALGTFGMLAIAGWPAGFRAKPITILLIALLLFLSGLAGLAMFTLSPLEFQKGN